MTEDYKIKWSKCLEIIRDNIGETKTNTWFSCARPISFVDNRLTLGIPSRFFMRNMKMSFMAFCRAL